MVTRTSQDINLTPKFAASTVPLTGAGASTPNVAEKSILDEKSPIENRMLQAILGKVEGGLQKGLDISREEAYLRGSAAAASGQEESEIESNPMTRDWAVGGYRDTSGKLQIAQEQAKFNTDILKLREQSPEKMQEYLAQRRAKLEPAFNGMTLRERENTFGKLLLADQAAIATHANEHRKFIVEQIDKGYQASNAIVQFNLNQGLASQSPQEYQKQVDAFVGQQYMTLNDDRLQPEHKEAIVVQAVKEALQNNNVKAYTDLRGGATKTLPDGTTVTSPNLLGRLSIKAQEQLSSAHRETLARTDGARLMDLNNEISHALAAMKDGTWEGGEAAVKNLQGRALALNPGKDYSNLMDTFLEEGRKNKDNAAVIAAAVTGDHAKVTSLGKTQEEAFNLVEKSWDKASVPMATRQSIANDMALKGNTVAAKYIGRTTDAIIMGLTAKDGMLPAESSNFLKQQIEGINALEAAGKTQSSAAMLEGMSDAARVRFQRLRSLATTGSVQAAFLQIQSIEDRESKMTPHDKKIEMQADDEQHKKFRDEVRATGAFMGWLGKFTRTEGAVEMAPRTSLFDFKTDNPKVTGLITDNAYTTYKEEYQAYRLNHPSMSPEQVNNVAAAAASARTVVTPDGPMFFPKGQTAQSYFNANYDKEQLGKAIGQVLPKSAPENRYVYQTAQGYIQAQQYDKDGKEVGSPVRIEKQQVLDKVDANLRLGKARYNEAEGTGVMVSVGGQNMNITGRNTASMDSYVMLDARKALFKYEGFSATPKPDVGGQKDSQGNPVMTVGIGVSSTNTYYPKPDTNGVISTAQHIQAFNDATNEAAANAVKFTRAIGKTSAPMQQVAMEMIYQSGVGNVAGGSRAKADPAYAAYFSNSDPDKAVELLKQTPAYRYSADPKNPTRVTPRQRHYIELTMQAFPQTQGAGRKFD